MSSEDEGLSIGRQQQIVVVAFVIHAGTLP